LFLSTIFQFYSSFFNLSENLLHKFPQNEIREDRGAEKEFVESQRGEIISPNSRSTNFHKPVFSEGVDGAGFSHP